MSPSNEEIAGVFNSVVDYANINIAARVEDHEDPDLAHLFIYRWSESSYSMGSFLKGYVVDRAWVVGNLHRLPDKALTEQVYHALHVSHPEVLGISSKQTLESWNY